MNVVIRRHGIAAIMLIGLPIVLLYSFLLAELALQAKFSRPQRGEIVQDSYASKADQSRIWAESECWSKAFSGSLPVPDCSGRSKSVQREDVVVDGISWSIQGVAQYFGFDYLVPESISAKTSAKLDKSFFVVLLEWLIWACAVVQVNLVVLTRGYPDRISRWTDETFYLSDWALNSPPIFGVLVNLYAFAEMLSRNVSSLNSDFLHFFGEAVVTTIIGGMVYVLNLFVRVFIKYPPELSE